VVFVDFNPELMRQRLLSARAFLGMNRKEFAAALGVPYRTVTNYENGSREPGSEYILKVADYCCVTTDWLLGFSDNARAAAPGSEFARLLSAAGENDQVLIREYLKLPQADRDAVIRFLKNACAALSETPQQQQARLLREEADAVERGGGELSASPFSKAE
jgi:transcriptional regulator with XRE-family HTH domain